MAQHSFSFMYTHIKTLLEDQFNLPILSALPLVESSHSLDQFSDKVVSEVKLMTCGASHLLNGSESLKWCADRKQAIDQALRDFALALLSKLDESDTGADSSRTITQLCALVSVAVALAQADECQTGTPFWLLADLFDCLTLEDAERLFALVESLLPTWKSEPLFTNGKNHLLKMCNELQKRLSRTQSQTLRGRVQLFLTRLFPLDEKSSLNLGGAFNTDSALAYNVGAGIGFGASSSVSASASTTRAQPVPTAPDAGVTATAAALGEGAAATGAGARMSLSDETAEEGELIAHALKPPPAQDAELYARFWSLQGYLRNPALLYEKQHWPKFIGVVDEVLSLFATMKLEPTRRSDSPTNDGADGPDATLAEPGARDSGDVEMSSDAHTPSAIDTPYFTAYLTNEHLLNMQLMDAEFRRCILIQILIVLQYLQLPVKFKTNEHVLAADQASWVRSASTTCHQLLRESAAASSSSSARAAAELVQRTAQRLLPPVLTPDEGELIVRSVQRVLSSEEQWSAWKNEGCLSYLKPPTQSKAAASRKRRGNALVDKEGQKLLRLGHAGLTRLWNICPDNMLACRTGALPSDSSSSLSSGAKAPAAANVLQRQLMPNVEDLFQPAIDELSQLDDGGNAPTADTSKLLVGHPTWQWLALRVLSRKYSPFFQALSPTASQATGITPAAQAARQVEEYLVGVAQKLSGKSALGTTLLGASPSAAAAASAGATPSTTSTAASSTGSTPTVATAAPTATASTTPTAAPPPAKSSHTVS